ncbi:MAG TPA: ATP-binding protein, partial [Actinomycetota bacterium]|nr:ATP-binding protein [Actinomycetota bacterium]
ISAIAAVALVALIESFVFRSAGTAEAIRDARTVSATVGRGIVEPALRNGVLSGDPKAIAALDRVVHRRVLDASLVRVKVWDATGRIVYSDEPRLIGSRYPLGADEIAAIRGDGAQADLSDLSAPENRFERRFGKLLEVYLPVHTPNGTPLLFESYLRYREVAASGRKVWLGVVPALLIGLVVLALVQIPLAWRMARNVERGRQDRERLLRRAVEASAAERRRIAGDLHDGVVQDFAGLSMSLSAAADRAASSGDADAADALRSGADRTRHGMRQLRTLLVELYPPNLHTAGLEPALSDLLAPLAAKGMRTTLDVEPDLQVDPTTEAVVFRTAQEALRNVQNHAAADGVEVRLLGGADGTLVLTVEDNGRGFTPDEADRSGERGHMGLALLAALAEEAGGVLDVDSAPGEGTTVRLEVPPQ